MVSSIIILQENLLTLYVLNLTDSLATITSPEGAFRIPAKVGDSLVFSIIGYSTRAMIVSEEEDAGGFRKDKNGSEKLRTRRG